MTTLQFTKMHGLGNDFMVVDAVHQSFHPTPELIRQLSDRHTGIGFDQLLMIEPTHASATDFFYRIFNADGGEALQCGNGARCIAKFIHEKKLSDKKHINVATRTGHLELYLQSDGQVKVNMGIPHFKDFKEIESVKIGVVSIGNLHGVIQVDDISKVPVDLQGEKLTTLYPEGLNVGFMQVHGPRHISLRVYERGVGETLGCGSGACAAVAVGRVLNLLEEHVKVDLTGGTLTIQWTGGSEPLWMTGEAVTVFDGTISL